MIKKLKKWVVGAVMVGVLAMPFAGCGGNFVQTTDRIGKAMTIINMNYAILESVLEFALNTNLPDAALIQGYINLLKNLRDTLVDVNTTDVEKVEAASLISAQLVKQARELLELR